MKGYCFILQIFPLLSLSSSPLSTYLSPPHTPPPSPSLSAGCLLRIIVCRVYIRTRLGLASQFSFVTLVNYFILSTHRAQSDRQTDRQSATALPVYGHYIKCLCSVPDACPNFPGVDSDDLILLSYCNRRKKGV